MNFLIDAFEPAFMQRALIGGLLAVVATSLVGTWVVLRGLAFLGDALAHGVVPGIALAVLWSFNPLVGAFIAALVMSGLITFVSNRTVMRDDTAIGLLFVGMLALGVLIISKAKSFATDVTAILFGDALGVTRTDLRNQSIAAVIVIVLTILLYRPFLALTFNQVKAQTLGMRPRLAQAALLTLIALSIVSSFQAIGTLLVFGLIVAPPATAALLVNRIVLIMLVSVASGSLAVLFGLLLSFHYGTAGGATIAVLSVLQFFAVLGGQSLMQISRNRRQRNVLEPDSID
ncbi:MAG: metal ABC transporter permease [Acidimicrobiales bacterium]|nr:metal ABC transporter permease [Acidimicrobiales bacterium]|tara:strand:- start:1172 stop:2035 length:864 start_codon:yes stop_codon:yes gene_type:complete